MDRSDEIIAAAVRELGVSKLAASAPVELREPAPGEIREAIAGDHRSEAIAGDHRTAELVKGWRQLF